MDIKKEKLILIDGNSLFNRAFYAMSVFSTKDGLPTNGIFGFIKLLFKIIEDKSPDYLAVAFDMHAPTFRHKMYSGYKATRKPMPRELVVQVPVLKDALRAMNIRIYEMEGYEADDIIGTIARKFGGVTTYIYTGDRDAYQLVDENINICFTRRGVSDVDFITAENFKEKVGLDPWQIVEEKALMGDNSDNIPGVKGIGPKSALELLQTYGSVENLYAHIESVPLPLKKKLEENEEMARLSHELAIIDTDAPISVVKEECRLTLPFPESARKFFARLEFRSLVDTQYFAGDKLPAADVVECSGVNDVLPLLASVKEFAFVLQKKSCNIYFDGKEYHFSLCENFLDSGVFLADLKPLLSELFSGDRLAIVADMKGLLHRLDEVGLTISCRVEDVTLLRYLGDSNLRSLGAEDFVKDYDLPWDNLAFGVRLAYDDAMRTMKGTEEEKLYRELELPLESVLFSMERDGVRMDTDKFPEFSQRYNAELATLSARIFELAQVDSFNLNSPFRLSEILFDKLGFDTRGIKKNIRGGYSTSAEVLERLAEEHEIARLILRYREVQKLQSTYIDGIRPLIVNGIVHTTYNQTMTTTGRLSSANPNLQNIPIRTEEGRELRKLFVAREGNILVDADYSQIELRLLAHLSGCKALVEAYTENEDIHAATAARVFGTSLAEVTPAMRRRSKTINFGIIYGMSAFGLAKDLGCSASEAQDFINKYFATHPEVKEYMDANVEFARKNGFITTILGRKRYIPELKSPSYNLRSFGERAAMNMPLQGSAADIIKIAMLNVSKRLKDDGIDAKLVLQVHDELIIDTPIPEAERATCALKEEMEHAVTLKVPLIAEVSSGRSWYDAK